MKNILLLTLVLTATTALGASRYSCELKARDNLMQNFEKVTGEFGGDRNLELRARDFRLKVKSVTVDGTERVALWLGLGTYRAAVTLGDPDADSHYLNLVMDHPFAVAECRRL